MLTAFKKETQRNIHLRREKEIVAMDSVTAGREEFVVMDIISIMEKKFVLVAESKKSCAGAGEALKQCLLAFKDTRDNGGGSVYGFVTTGEQWRMIRYDGTSFVLSDIFHTLSGAVQEEMDEGVSGSTGVTGGAKRRGGALLT